MNENIDSEIAELPQQLAPLDAVPTKAERADTEIENKNIKTLGKKRKWGNNAISRKINKDKVAKHRLKLKNPTVQISRVWHDNFIQLPVEEQEQLLAREKEVRFLYYVMQDCLKKFAAQPLIQMPEDCEPTLVYWWLKMYSDDFPMTTGYVPDAKTFFDIFGVNINAAKTKQAGFDSNFRKYGMRVVIGGDPIYYDFMVMLHKYTQLHPQIDPEITQVAAEFIASRAQPTGTSAKLTTLGFIEPLSSSVQREAMLNQGIRTDVLEGKHSQNSREKS